MAELDERIDALYAGTLERFTAERDALAAERKAAGDAEGARTVKALRKPVASAWALNALAREDPEAIRELVRVGERLRDAHRRAVSGGDAEAFREAADERRKVVETLTRRAVGVLERADAGSSAQAEAISGTLEAATVDEETAGLLVRGRLVKPVQPPATFADAGLRVLEGGRPRREPEPPPEPAPDASKLRTELSAAETRERRAAAAVERERERIAQLERKRSEARERLRGAEAEHRGVSLERKRIAAALAKLETQRRR